MLPLHSSFLMQNSFSQTWNILGNVEQCGAYDPSRSHYIRKPVLRVISFATQFACAPAHPFFLSFLPLFFFFNKVRSTISRAATFVLARSSLVTQSSTKPNFRELLIVRGHVRLIVPACSLRAILLRLARAHNCAKRAHVVSCQNLTPLVGKTERLFSESVARTV